jgi:hypothetical protein
MHSLQRFKTINTTACFVAYLQGSSLKDIAEQYGVAERTLKEISRSENWSNLALTAQDHVSSLGEHSQAPQKLQENREKNFAQAERLRNELDKTLREVTLDGSLAIAPEILNKITKAASEIHDLTYRALGDKDKQRDPREGGGGVGAQVIINLPSAIAQPRASRTVTDATEI